MMLKNFFAVLIVACWTVQVLQAAAADDVHSEWEKHKVSDIIFLFQFPILLQNTF
jgi:hypothetical protein